MLRHSVWHKRLLGQGWLSSLLFSHPGAEVGAQQPLCLGSLEDFANRRTQESTLQVSPSSSLPVSGGAALCH